MSALGILIASIRRNGFIISFLKLKERLQTKHFFRLFNRKKWFQASYLGERLIANYPERVWLYRSLIECYHNLKEEEKATRILEKYLNLRYNNLSRLMKEIESRLSTEHPVSSRYIWLGGHQNIGFMEHQVEGKKYLTKISISKEWREGIFYSNIYNKFAHLKNITPKMQSLIEPSWTDMQFLTFEKIEEKEYVFTVGIIEEAIKKVQIISSIKYTDVYEILPTSYCRESKEYYLANKRPFGILRYFNEIHKEVTNKEIIIVLLSQMGNLNYSLNSIDLVNRIKRVIIDNKMYTKIIPHKHFSLRHGDLTLKNIIIDNRNENLLFLDWGQAGIGPRWYDIAGLLGSIKIPYDKINSLYLSNENGGKHLETVEKLFFIYTLILVWFITLSKHEFENGYKKYLLPAIKHLEQLEEQMLNSEVCSTDVV